MARNRSVIAFLATAASCLLVVAAAADPKDSAERPARPEPPRRFFPHIGPEGEAMRERTMREIQKLSPEQRADLWKAVWAVLNLPAEKRQMLMGFEEDRRNKAREEIQRAMDESGIRLDEETKKVFFRRYFEERHLIEEKIRQESEGRRRELVRDMRERLKKEFAPGPRPVGSEGNPPK